MSKHTPGPWSRNKYGSVIGPDGKDVLFRAVSTLCSGADEKMAMAEANTDLATMAPEFLELLELAIECGMVPVTSAKEGGAAKYSRQVFVADKIRAAIAKAKGESA